MKSVLEGYKGAGRLWQRANAKRSTFIFEGVQPPIWQTPGRLQYYRAENEPFIPDEIKWQIRMPTRVAQPVQNLRYKDEIESQIEAFLASRIEYDYLKGDRQINMDLTIEQANTLFNAGDKIREMANNGSLQQIHEKCSDLDSKVEASYIKVMDALSRIQPALSMTDRLGDQYGIRLGQQTEDDKEAQEERIVETQLEAFIEGTKISIQEKYNAHVAKDKLASEYDLKQMNSRLASCQFAGELNRETVEGDAKIIVDQVDAMVAGEIKDFFSLIDAHKEAHDEKDAIYENYTSEAVLEEADQIQDEFKEELNKHLAMQIVLKEHKVRYQKEQWDRFIMSCQWPSFKDEQMSLREYATEYAMFCESIIDSSHGYRCPKIDANYDDYEAKTVRPLNATIFYYFFSSSKASRGWAQMLLSSIRYPNEQMRRAYVRFFA